MNSIHNNGENDSSFNSGLDPLSRAYGRLEKNEPPELLDQAILNSAHRAVEKKPRWMSFGWLHGLSTAAVFVLAISLILNQREPAPVYENGMRRSEPARLQIEKMAKKQLSVGQSDDSPMDIKAEGEYRQNDAQNAPIAASLESPKRETATQEEAVQSVSKPQFSAYDQADRQSHDESLDYDGSTTELLQEEMFRDESDLKADAPEIGAFEEQLRPATVASPAVSEMKTRSQTESEAEQKLLAIIKLKQSGDERWKSELESFKQSYPDYPLPDELSY